MRNGERSIENDRTIFIIRSISCFNINSIYGVIFMSDYNWCHGPTCHEKRTQDRIRGVKGSKVLRTRKIALDCDYKRNGPWGVFCSTACYNDFFYKYFRQVVAIAPRLEPLETPCEVTTRKVQGTSYNWQTRETEPHTYTEKTIVVDNVNR